LLSLDGARTLIDKRFEAVALIDEVVVDEVDKHIHGTLSHFLHVDMESGDRWTEDVGVFGSDKRDDLNVLWDL
jgi:hypothetical protein